MISPSDGLDWYGLAPGRARRCRHSHRATFTPAIPPGISHCAQKTITPGNAARSKNSARRPPGELLEKSFQEVDQMNVAAPLAPLASHPLLVLLTTVMTLLGLAFLLGRLAQRLGLPAVVGELLAGVLVGPSLLGNLFAAASWWLVPACPPEPVVLAGAVGQVVRVVLVVLIR